MTIEVAKLSADQLRNLIANHRKNSRMDAPLFLEAMAELARREGQGLDFQTSMRIVRDAAREGRFISYKQLADASGVDWGKAHYAINDHLWNLIEYAHRRDWPLLSAVIVNKPNVATGEMEPDTLKGFVNAARLLGYVVTDEEAFLREQQQRVFAWAQV
jgi:hypothetical protein